MAVSRSVQVGASAAIYLKCVETTHSIKARMALRQLTRVPALLNREPAGPIRSLQILEPVDGDPTRAGDELQQA